MRMDDSQLKGSDAMVDEDKDNKVTQSSTTAHRQYRRSIFVGRISLIIVVLVLALGLGLGLGLKPDKHNSVTAPSGVKQVPRSKLVDPSQFVLSPSFNINSPAQSREFNWTLSEINSSPAGITKNMLVVNGISPGPTVEANIGDRHVAHI